MFALSDRGATSETARWLADSENRSDLIGGAGSVSLGDKDQMLAGILLDLSMTASLSSSLNVGQKVLSNMGRITPPHKRRVERGRLHGAEIAGTSPRSGRDRLHLQSVGSQKLQTSSHQQALARSIQWCAAVLPRRIRRRGPTLHGCVIPAKIAAGPRERVVRSGESRRCSPSVIRSAWPRCAVPTT